MARSLDFRSGAGAFGVGRTGRRRSALPQHRQLRRMAGGLQAGGGVAGHFAAGDLRGARRRDVRSGHHPARQRAGRVPAELPAIRRPHDGGGPLSERAEAVEGPRRAVVAHRGSDRRAAAGGGRAVGSGKRLRRLQGRHLQHHPLGGDAGLRLPAPGVLPRPVDGRGAHRRARRPAAGPDDRQLGGRAWADAVHAVRTISSTASTSTATAAST